MCCPKTGFKLAEIVVPRNFHDRGGLVTCLPLGGDIVSQRQRKLFSLPKGRMVAGMVNSGVKGTPFSTRSADSNNSSRVVLLAVRGMYSAGDCWKSSAPIRSEPNFRRYVSSSNSVVSVSFPFTPNCLLMITRRPQASGAASRIQPGISKPCKRGSTPGFSGNSGS